ncbi:alpha/beta hydrolase [Mucilaginibacter angelicae]|uniref:Alpha/beta hydrolase n=1 Tax=Mucilaginibacter angelicae TaxID=869718 RepID=A0ABV6LD41_9SPHI
MMKKIIFCAFLVFGQNFLLFSQVKISFFTGKIAALKSPPEHLFLAGDFNGWNPTDRAWELLKTTSGNYVLSKDFPTGIIHFKVTRGNWNTVECDADGKAIDNRNLVIKSDTSVLLDIAGWQDSFAQPEKKHTASARVHVISENFEMPQLGRQRRVWIYLPAGYDAAQTKYPVIYMHDGQNLFDEYTSSYGEWGIDELMDKMPAQEECIIVGIDHGDEYRMTEYNPYDSKYGKGRGEDYVQFLVKTLKPYIDTYYRTQNDAVHTTIAGSSMGGLISIYAALKYPEVFGNAGVFSPAFWMAPPVFDLARQTAISKSSRFYFVCGDAENDSMVADMQKMADIIKVRGITPANAPAIVIKGASHNEKQWNGDWPGFYKWLMGDN